MNTNPDKQKKSKQDKNANWLRNFAIGLLLFISGILSKFYPATVLTITYIVLGVILALIGISDAVAAFKYKQTGSDWKLVLAMGGISLITAIYFIPAVIYLYSVNVSIYVFSAWIISRGALNIAGVIRKTLKRKNVFMWGLIMVLAGIFLAVFCDSIVSYAVSYLAYVLLAVGVLLAFFGIYQKTDEKEIKEKKLREEAIQSGLDNAIKNAQTTTDYLSEPKPENIPVSDPESSPKEIENIDPADEYQQTAEDTDNKSTVSGPQTPVSEDGIEENADEEVVEVEAVEIQKTEETKTNKKGFLSSLFKK